MVDVVGYPGVGARPSARIAATLLYQISSSPTIHGLQPTILRMAIGFWVGWPALCREDDAG